jgi:hypothetical protein
LAARGGFTPAQFIWTAKCPGRPSRRLERLKKTGSHATARYAEFNSTGDGASPANRPDWTRQFKKSDAQKITVETVLGGADNCNPDFCRPFSAVRRKLKWGETGGEKLLLDTWRRAGDDCYRRQKNVHGMADAVLASCCE